MADCHTQKLRPSILQQLHNSVTGGHLGMKKTLSKVRQIFLERSTKVCGRVVSYL